jgi:hypothetical protein
VSGSAGTERVAPFTFRLTAIAFASGEFGACRRRSRYSSPP